MARRRCFCPSGTIRSKHSLLIVELHHGRLGLARRQGGGMSVSVWLPDREAGAAAAQAASRVRLTLTSA